MALRQKSRALLPTSRIPTVTTPFTDVESLAYIAFVLPLEIFWGSDRPVTVESYLVVIYIGAQDKAAAPKLWESLPPVYRQCVIAYTDFWAAYVATLHPLSDIEPSGRKAGKPATEERFNNTLRQQMSRLARKTLSFSKSLENQIGAIWYFIHHYNPHSADVGRIFLSVVKTWKRNAFGMKLCSFGITEACQIYLN